MLVKVVVLGVLVVGRVVVVVRVGWLFRWWWWWWWGGRVG